MHNALAIAALAMSMMGCSALSTYTEEGGSTRSKFLPNAPRTSPGNSDSKKTESGDEAAADAGGPKSGDTEGEKQVASSQDAVFELKINKSVRCSAGVITSSSGFICRADPAGQFKKIELDWSLVEGATSYIVVISNTETCDIKARVPGSWVQLMGPPLNIFRSAKARVAFCAVAKFKLEGKDGEDIEAINNPIFDEAR
jgi:hypothetical protein